MTPTSHQQSAAREFAAFWTGKGYEKGQTQPFWIGLLRVLGVENPDQGYIEFEDRAHIDAAHGFIDGYIPATHVLIEQKSLGKNLRAGIPQSDGSVLTPFQQAKRYAVDLPYSRRPRFIVVSNFAEFDIYDMENPNGEPERLLLKDLPKEFFRLKFLVDTGSETIRREEEISKRAGDVVGLIYDALLKQYRDPTNPQSLKSLNELCVRLVFLLYAEDADVFTHLQFHDYLKQFPAAKVRGALIDLFKVLDTPREKRDPYLDGDLMAFPYVNGGLFANENLEIPQFTNEILDLILRKGSEDFDWKDISPTIFGAVFESTLNPETRRSGGMHYTSVQNIHKVIDPLFLDSLKAALATAKGIAEKRARDAALRSFIDGLASLTFLDPACGSGNFLTETYICLRRLENEALAALLGNEMRLDLGDLVKVSISQFHGIEINDFAVAVAKTALWIAENQMLRETEAIAHRNIDFLPLKSYDGIVEGNALCVDWPRTSYIMGNPPFIGASMMTAEQKAEAVASFGKGKRVNSIDYVGAWYYKAAALMRGTETRAAFVSTNSITQGEQVAPLWKPLVERFGVSIDFAHRTFRWDSESNSKAHVHCVVVGFSCVDDFTRSHEDTKPCGGTLRGFVPSCENKMLFDGDRVSLVPHINAYLVAAPDAFVESRGKPLCDVPAMTYGNKPSDDGNLLLTEAEREALLAETPALAPFVRRYVGARDFIAGDEVRYCLWLRDASPALYHGCREVMRRLAAVRDFRLASTAAPTRVLADQPWRFFSTPQTDASYLAIPEVSSERRRYVPVGFLDASVIASNKLLIVPGATLYHFGVVTSNVHMAWMRIVTGRLKSDYQYSGAIVYNNFPWPIEMCQCENVANNQSQYPIGTGNIGLGNNSTMATIARTAQAILDARAAHPDCPLKVLYDELTMPPDLRRAHQDNDRAVMAAYGFKLGMTESECVAELFKRYQELVEAKEPIR